MQVLLLRHGRTLGNEKKRYIGVTEESLSPQGIEDCQKLGSLLRKQRKIQEQFPRIRVVVSPMKRCQESAKIVLDLPDSFEKRLKEGNGKHIAGFQEMQMVTEADLRECNFGIFENKNYLELQNEPLYQQWIDSDGTMDFPQGDCLKEWKNRSVQGFLRQMEYALREQADLVIFVVHGGSIMSIMECLEERGLGYYEYQVGNGDGFWAEYEMGRLCQVKRVIEQEEGKMDII